MGEQWRAGVAASRTNSVISQTASGAPGRCAFLPWTHLCCQSPSLRLLFPTRRHLPPFQHSLRLREGGGWEVRGHGHLEEGDL